MTRKFSGKALVVATHNAGKLKEIRAMLGGEGLELSTLDDHKLPAPPEDGETYLENGTAKALAAAKATGLPALADDSGLSVTALDGAPGVYSADWADTNPDGSRDFAPALAKVNEMLGDGKDRSAAFVCCLVLAWPDGHVEHVEGRVNGEIVWPPRGDGGFAYDVIFQPGGYNRTFAELSQDEKNGISHRAEALRKMREKCFNTA